MPFPLIPVIIAAAAALVVGGIAITCSFVLADVEDKADVTILFIGETEAGKDTVMELLKTRKFLKESRKTPQYEAITTTIKNKKIKIINTSGSDSTWEDTEKAKNIKHDIRCYIFDTRKFDDKDEKIKLGIQNTINECKAKSIKYMSLGTRGDEVSKEKIENKVRSMGIECSIFELSKAPFEQVIKFLFKEYL